MKKTSTYLIDFKVMRETEDNLKALHKTIANRNLSIHFQKSRGKVVDSLNESEQIFNQIGNALENIINKTRLTVTNTRISFQQAETDNGNLLENKFLVELPVPDPIFVEKLREYNRKYNDR